MSNTIMLLLGLFYTVPGRPVHAPEAPDAPACYVAHLVVVARDQRDRVIDRVATAGIWRFAIAGAPTAPRCMPADSGALRLLDSLLVQRLDSTNTNPGAHQSHVELRDTSLTEMQRTITSIANSAAATRGAFRRIEVLILPRDAIRGGSEIDPGPFVRDSATASTCAAESASLRRAGAPFRWAC